MKSSTFRLILISIYVTSLVWWVGILLSGSKAGPLNTSFNVYWCIAFSIFSLLNAYRLIQISLKFPGKRDIIVLFSLFLVGVLVWCLGDVIWVIYNVFVGIEVPFPSIADFLFLTSYFFLIVALIFSRYSFVILDKRTLTIRILSKIGLSLLISLPFSIVLFFLIGNSEAAQNYLNFMYVVSDILIIPLLILLFIKKFKFIQEQRLLNAFILLMVAYLLEGFADTVFMFSTKSGSYYNAGVADLMFESYLFFSSLAVNSFIQALYPFNSFGDSGFVIGPNFFIQLPYLKQVGLNLKGGLTWLLRRKSVNYES